MLTFSIRLSLVFACIALAGLNSSSGQTIPDLLPSVTNAAATNAPSATSPAKPFAMGDVVAQAQAAAAQLQVLQSGLDADPTLPEVADELPGFTEKIDQRIARDTGHAGSAATLNNLQTALTEWQSLSGSLDSAQKNLSGRVHDLDQLLWQLDQMDAAWKATLDLAKTSKAPAEITGRINDIRSGIAAARKNVQNHQAPLYAMQSRVAAQEARAQSGLAAVNKSLDAARQQLLEQNRPALWNPEAFAHPAVGVVAQERDSLDEQAAEVAAYLKAKIGAILVHFLIFVLLTFGFLWMRNTINLRAKKEPALQDAAHVFAVPFSNAVLIGLLAAAWLYPGQPRLLWAAVGATALIPTVVVTRRLIDPASLPILYATVIAFLVDQFRYVVTPAGILSRFLFIIELMAACIFILAALRFKHLSASAPEQTRLKRLTRCYLHVASIVLVFAGFANVFGYIRLSALIGNGMLESSYLAVILYATVRIVDAMAISAMSIRPLSGLGMVRRHHDLLYANTTVAIRWIFFAGWFVAALQFFSQLDPVWQEVNAVLWKDTYSWFNIEFTIGAVLAFPVTIWATFLLSRFIRFCLEEEVYPHLHLGRGIPYATSTMVHYTILLIGFFAAVAATGTQLSQFAFLAGAFGVGLGFGLQNIMNNFVSGVILLFERPIKVGDVIQIDPATMGTVERIGIRASVILLSNGAEVIVPNGNLISNPVTNWTLSNCERQIEIPVTVASKVDPETVFALLTNVAGKHPDVLKNPAPRAYLVAFAGASLTFRLSVWIDSAEEWMKVTSDLSLAINAALAKANIVIS
jgi:small-conductance mechanosensitive channel